jgi:hypothetical protein
MKDGVLIAIYLLVIAIACSIGLLQPMFEARSFNRCTGSNASYFDAAFTQLRVENCKH